MKSNIVYCLHNERGLRHVTKLLKTTAQVVFLIAFSKLADMLVEWLHLPIPGSILGILLLFALLKLGVIRLGWIELGTRWLLAEMLLFFIPSAVGIVDYGSLVADSGLRIAATIVVSTAAVMACSGWIGGRIAAYKEKKTV